MTCFLWRMISTSSSHSSTNLASCMAVFTWREGNKQLKKPSQPHFKAKLYIFTDMLRFNVSYILLLVSDIKNVSAHFFFSSSFTCSLWELCKTFRVAGRIICIIAYRARPIVFHFIKNSAHQEKCLKQCAPGLKITCEEQNKEKWFPTHQLSLGRS